MISASKAATYGALASFALVGVSLTGEIATGMYGRISDSESRGTEIALKAHDVFRGMKLPAVVVGSVLAVGALARKNSEGRTEIE